MKILLYTLIFPPDVCSNAYVFTDFSRQLKKMGHDVVVITTTPHYDSLHSAEKKAKLAQGKEKWYKISSFEGMNVFHIDVAAQKGSYLQRIRTFYKFSHYPKRLIKIEKIKADVVIAQTPPPTIGYICKSISRVLNSKSVLILQDLWVDAMIDRGTIKGVIAKVLRYIETKSYDKVDYITTISTEMLENLKGHYSNFNKLYMIPNFVDDKLYYPRIAGLNERTQYSVGKDDFVFSYVGNIGEAQNLDPLLTFAEKHKNENIKILIAGNGVKEEYYKNEAIRKKLNSIIFLGYLTREETTVINSLSDVCLVMLAEHVMATSFPSKIYTIMAMGKPILISCNSDSSAGRFIIDNEIGWTVDCSQPEEFEKKALKIIYGKENRNINQYGKNALALVRKNYSVDVVAQQYIDMINGKGDEEYD